MEHHWKVLRGFAAKQMPELASNHWKEVLRPVKETRIGDGKVQFSSVSQAKKLSRDYFLQYLLGSPRMMVYMTVEGYGSADDAALRFERILATQRWDE